MPCPEPPRPPPQPTLLQRLQPWVDLLYKLVAGVAALVAAWRALHG
ncbi:MAG TPA: hypothetical protein VE684_13775 [Crenalkalicoccus sp.]|nr:hypothetical protein [Crenalkalicoccus sp.]